MYTISTWAASSGAAMRVATLFQKQAAAHVTSTPHRCTHGSVQRGSLRGHTLYSLLHAVLDSTTPGTFESPLRKVHLSLHYARYI